MRSPTDRDYYLKLKSAFERICDLAPGEREHALSSSCGDNHELRRDLEELLAADGRSASLGPLSPGSTPPADLAPGPAGPAALPTVPGYRVRREIGRGGMAVVYLAEQERPRREVALKVIRPVLVNDRMIRRFSHEVDVLARLQHQGIARIFDTGVFHRAGDREPQPYFAMELVEGLPVNEYCTGRKLDQAAIVELFARVCDAVHHAHMRGVVHRDLKPSNILVTRDGDPKVLDFGVARLTDPDTDLSCHTIAGQLIGTPQYMSPEQSSQSPSEVDSRSDIYALGLVLYELLSGAPAFDVAEKPLLEILHLIRTTDPVPLSRRGKHLRGDLESIVSRAIARAPEQRYSAASDLASDLRRHLKHEPIIARPLSRRYLLALAAKRNRGLVAGIAIALACTSIGGAAAAVAWRRAAQVSQQNSQLSDVLASALTARGLSQSGRELTFQAVLDRAERRLTEIKDPLTLGRMCSVVGGAYMDLEVWDRAEPILKRAVNELTTALGDGHTLVFDARESHLRARAQLYLRDRSVAQQTVEGLEALLSDREAIEGPLSRGALATRLALAEAVGSRYLVPERLADASAMMAELEPLLENVLGETDPLLVRALRSHAAVESWRYRRRLASELNDRALAILEHSGSADEIDVLTCMQTKANLLRLRGLTGSASQCYDSVIDRADLTVPADSYIRWQLRHYRGRLRTSMGQYVQAEDDIRTALNEMYKFSKRGSTDDCLSALVELLLINERYQEAIDPMERFWTDDKVAPGTVENAWQAELGIDLALLYHEAGRLSEASQVLDNIEDYERAAGAVELNADSRAFHRAVSSRVRGGDPSERLDAYLDYFRASFGKSGIPPGPLAKVLVVVRWIIAEYLALGDIEAVQAWTRELELLPLRTKIGRNLLASDNLAQAESYLADRAADVLANPHVSEFEKADLAAVLRYYSHLSGRPVPGAEFLSVWVPPPVTIDGHGSAGEQ
ncbi:MAG: Serine/threonine-protein kinase PknD [Phycisphaerales bacterium]|nr:Serine/threonine-protein kinase PknD [Phycisphaerales bacterium]